MRGGNEMGTLTVSRFFVAHVFLLPAALIGFIAAHVYLFRKAGAAGPPSEDPVHPRLPTQRFYPRQVVMDTIVALLMILVLGCSRILRQPSLDRKPTQPTHNMFPGRSGIICRFSNG